MVEKLRRDRINTSIEQLKTLLGQEFVRQQPDSKQEKADILEMAVSYLKIWRPEQKVHKQRPEARGEGYAHCVQEAVTFLSKSRSSGPLLNHFLGLQASSKGPQAVSVSPPGSPLHQTGPTAKEGGQAPVWRPW